MIKNFVKKQLSNFPKIYLTVVRLYNILLIMKTKIICIISAPLLIFPIQKEKIVVCNYKGKGYGDNGKYIVKEIISQGLKYDIVWLLNKSLINKTVIPEQVRIVEYGTLKSLYELSTAKIWIDNCRKDYYPIKRKGQHYIQTWHGGIALKKVEKDAASQLGLHYIMSAKNDSKMADIFISNSKFCTRMYRDAFWYNKEILEIGSPRCDLFFCDTDEVKNKVKSHYHIDTDSKILIYAPTFRQAGLTSIYNIDFNRLLKVLQEKFKSKWTILVRLHPNISNKSNFMEYSNDIINATDYDDMYELMAASDILITDYSSTMFEFSFMKKPVFLYCPDIDSYKKERNFYFELHELPYPVVEDNESLLLKMKSFDRDDYLRDLNPFLNRLGLVENGHASKELLEYVKKIIN